MTQERFEFLLKQYRLQQMTEEELKEFFEAAALPEFELVIKAALDRDLHSAAVSGSSKEGQAQQSFESFKQLMASGDSSTTGKYRRMPGVSRAWRRYAAIFVLVAGMVAWMLLKKAPHQPAPEQLAQHDAPIDIAPGGNKARLTLADGTSIVLDSSQAGTLAIQGNARIEKTASGEVVYRLQETPGGERMMNTMSTPRGGQYRLTLPDGSKVWLNAASSITYPTAFAGKERMVSVTGEVYFEVAKNAAQPFIVKKGATSVTVLGTHFNVNAYEDEEQLKVTLLEGSVRVNVKSETANGKSLSPFTARPAQAGFDISRKLSPGQQALVQNNQPAGKQARVAVLDNVELDKIMAWKNGIFSFNKASLQEVMWQLSRWYNVEVVYEKGIPAMEFGGEMGRDLTLAQVLKGFEDMEVHFRIEAGNRLIVMP